MEKKVTKIAAIPQLNRTAITAVKRRKACGYARVSTGLDSQESSYENQMRHYERYIKSRGDLEFVGMYSDAGVTGTSTRHREGFNSMVQDALDGKIDLIITKSVSRFARNTVDCLSTIRLLKENGVEVYFEEQNIYTLDSAGELLITIMSSLAQEESHTISENTKWGLRKCAADGKVSLAYSRFLGYDKGANGTMVINPEQAEVVRDIFRLYLEGNTCHGVATQLNKNGVPTIAGGKLWRQDTIKRILQNEKYKGEALLQKTYTLDFISKKSVKNDGVAVPQYYVENDHEAIIPREVFDKVQEELQRRREDREQSKSVFHAKLRCPHCGGWYGPKIVHASDKYRKVVYRCNNRYKRNCKTAIIGIADVEAAFISAMNKLLQDKKKALAFGGDDIKAMQARQQELLSAMQTYSDASEQLVAENAEIAQDQACYQRRFNELIDRYDAARAEYEELELSIAKARESVRNRRNFAEALEKVTEPLTEFDPELWRATVDCATIYSAKDIRVRFKNGVEVKP